MLTGDLCLAVGNAFEIFDRYVAYTHHHTISASSFITVAHTLYKCERIEYLCHIRAIINTFAFNYAKNIITIYSYNDLLGRTP